MGSLGLPEIIFILVLALLIFGPKRLPEIGRTLGKGMAEFRKASNDLKRTINAELALDEDEQTRHPRRMETGPVASIVQALSPPPATSPASVSPETPAPPYQDIWRPQEPPAGTVAQVSPMAPITPMAPIVPIVTPAPAPHVVDPHDPRDPHDPVAPIEPS
jgi:TatA/E family protein of Tat protein translocase